MIRWRTTALAVAATACIPGLACATSSAPRPASTAPSGAPRSPISLAARLVAAEARLRTSLQAWRASDPALLEPPSKACLAAARQERAIVHLLAQQRALARRTLAALPARLAAATSANIAAAVDLRRLTGAPTGSRLRLVPARPTGELLADYHLAERRFGVRWQVLAAVNLVESAFGRVANHSNAGAQGPMQFMPSTWRAYGLGGDINSPHDAILAAANYLHRSGAPGDERRALYAYNPSRLYVDAVLIYAHEMSRDPLAFLAYYAWEASLPASLGG